MSQSIGVKVPDIGDFKEVEVIEVLVAEGDTIAEEQSLITVESDKASMEIPSSHAGVIKSLKVKLGDKVAEGTVLVELEPIAEASQEEASEAEDAKDDDAGRPDAASEKAATQQPNEAPVAKKDTDAEPAAPESVDATQSHTLRGGEPPRTDTPAGNVAR